MSEYTPTHGERDRIVRDVLAYAASEGLSELGKVQAAVRFGMEAGIAAERERCVRIAESRHDVGWEGREVLTARFPYEGRRIAAAIRAEGVVEQ